MPETSRAPQTTAQLAATLASLADGPHADAGTAAAAETIGYLNHAAPPGRACRGMTTSRAPTRP
jgi:hypothetical protein